MRTDGAVWTTVEIFHSRLCSRPYLQLGHATSRACRGRVASTEHASTVRTSVLSPSSPNDDTSRCRRVSPSSPPDGESLCRRISWTCFHTCLTVRFRCVLPTKRRARSKQTRSAGTGLLPTRPAQRLQCPVFPPRFHCRALNMSSVRTCPHRQQRRSAMQELQTRLHVFRGFLASFGKHAISWKFKHTAHRQGLFCARKERTHSLHTRVASSARHCGLAKAFVRF